MAKTFQESIPELRATHLELTSRAIKAGDDHFQSIAKFLDRQSNRLGNHETHLRALQEMSNVASVVDEVERLRVSRSTANAEIEIQRLLGS